MITCWLLGSFEALPASAFEHGQQDKQPSCRSLMTMLITMVMITMVLITMVMMAMVIITMMTVKRRRRMVMLLHVQQDKQPSCRSLIVMTMIMVIITMVVIMVIITRVMIMPMMAMMTVKRRMRMVMLVHGQL